MKASTLLLIIDGKSSGVEISLEAAGGILAALVIVWLAIYYYVLREPKQ